MKNLTEGKPLKLIFLFALPLMLGNLLQQLYTMVDTMIVGQFVGVDALASIGGADWINWAILGLLMGFTQGFSIRVSNCLGAQDEKGMEQAIAMSFLSCLIIGLIVTVVAHIVIVPLLHLLNTPDNTIHGSILYLRIMSSGVIIVIFYNCFSSVLRAIGDSQTPLRAMIIAACMNIILDLVAVCVFHMGIAGAAIATVISQLFAAFYCYKTLNNELPFVLTKKSFQIDVKLIKQLVKLGMPLACQNMIIAIGGIILQSVVNGFGFLFIAGYTATNKFYGILEVVSISFGYAITTFTSQNYGAKKYERMKNGVFQANLLSVIISLVILLVVILFGKNALMLFISASPKQTQIVLQYAYDYLFVMAVCLPVLYILYSYRSALQGMENTFIPMVSGIVELIMRVSAALILPRFIGVYGIYIAEVLAWFGAAVLLYISYRINIKKIEKNNIMIEIHEGE